MFILVLDIIINENPISRYKLTNILKINVNRNCSEPI
jgi:hypothetical protein